ncbi:MAG: hypothetical protein ACLRNW_24665 [Neglectibacter sp.]
MRPPTEQNQQPAEELGIPNQVLTGVYFICMENVNMLWEQLNHPYAEQDQPEGSAGAGQ